MTLRRLNDSTFSIVAMTTTLAVIINGGCSSTAVDKPGTDSPLTTTDGGADGPAIHACPVGLPLPKSPCFTCDPVPPGGDAGCGAPLPKLFGWDGSGIPQGVSYPIGCSVFLPVENPYYPGGAQSCDCSTFGSATPSWSCPI